MESDILKAGGVLRATYNTGKQSKGTLTEHETGNEFPHKVMSLSGLCRLFTSKAGGPFSQPNWGQKTEYMRQAFANISFKEPAKVTWGW